jgi:hypothetical protein
MWKKKGVQSTDIGEVSVALYISLKPVTFFVCLVKMSYRCVGFPGHSPFHAFDTAVILCHSTLSLQDACESQFL